MSTEIGPGRRTTIKDIAERAGVSKGAVSYALNGRPGVSDETRDRILAIADELGWYPNRAARALSASRADACGLILARPASTIALEPFFMEFIAGVEACLSPRAIGLTIQLVRTVEEEIAIYRSWFGEHRVDGVFVFDIVHDDPRAEALSAIGLPAVVIGGPLRGPSSARCLARRGLRRRRGRAVPGGARAPQDRPRRGRFGVRPHRGADAGVPGRVRELGLDAEVVSTDYTPESGTRATRRLLSAPEAADGDHLRQRPPRRHRPRRRAADGILGPRRPLADRVGRLADQPRRASAADRDHARHRRLRRDRRGPPAPGDRGRDDAQTSRFHAAN